MELTAHVGVLGRDVDVRLEVAPGTTLALVGPNGAGKSSILHVLAGQLRADSGRARLGDRVLFDTETGAWTPPHKRGVGMLAQDALLFPRMTAAQNVMFAARAGGRGTDPRTWLAAAHAEDLADRRPGELSGGQQQRVAIARALAAEPSLLLLDEPLSALDQPVAAQIRQTLRQLLADRTTVLVTHEILDAALLADSIAVLQHGRVVESGPTEQILHRPRTAFAATLCGLNLIRGEADGARLLTELGEVTGIPSDDGLAGPAVATFSPASVSVHRRTPEGSPRNTFGGRVDAITPQGHLVRVRVGDLSADLTPAALSALRLATGDEVHLAVKAAEVNLYPA